LDFRSVETATFVSSRQVINFVSGRFRAAIVPGGSDDATMAQRTRGWEFSSVRYENFWRRGRPKKLFFFSGSSRHQVPHPASQGRRGSGGDHRLRPSGVPPVLIHAAAPKPYPERQFQGQGSLIGKWMKFLNQRRVVPSFNSVLWVRFSRFTLYIRYKFRGRSRRFLYKVEAGIASR